MPNPRRNLEAQQRAAARRQREDDAPRLHDKVPGLESLKLEVDEVRGAEAVAGATHIGWRDFLLGTFLGMMPGIIVIATFIDRTVAVVNDPRPETIMVLIAVVAVAVMATWWLQKRVARPLAAAPPTAEHVG